MMRRILIIISCLLVSSPSAQADDKEKTMFAAATQASPRWQQTRADMEADDYRRTTRDNQKVISRGLAAWSRETLADSGAFAPALGLLGTTIDLALNDRRYDLNETGSMGLLVRDSARSSRALLFEYRMAW